MDKQLWIAGGTVGVIVILFQRAVLADGVRVRFVSSARSAVKTDEPVTELDNFFKLAWHTMYPR